MLQEFQIKEGWLTVVCLLLILVCVSWAIQAAEWTGDLSLALLQLIVLVGGVTGLVLAKSHLPNRMAHLLAMLAGFAWSVYLTGSLLSIALEATIDQAISQLAWRIQIFPSIVFSPEAAADNFHFVLLLALLLWIMAYVCAWAVFRWQQTWWAVILCGIALILNISYSTHNLTVYLLLYLLFSLLLIVRTSLASYEQEWKIAGVSYNSELVFIFVRAGLIVSAIAILLAWITPEALASKPAQQAWDKFMQPWRKIQDQSSRIFQDLNYQNEPLYLRDARKTWFGGPPNLGDTPVVDIRASSGRYWRVMVYHEYTSDGWLNTDVDTILIGENEKDLAFPELELRRQVSQTFTLKQELGQAGTIIAAGQPLRSQLPLRAVVAYITHGDDFGRSERESPYPPAPGDPSILYSQNPLQVGTSYQVLSSLTIADEESLRQAGTNYPEWVAPRYTELPETLPERVRDLAESIAQDLDSPLDKANAIEGFLRQIPYNDQISGPAPGQDGVDYFLFDAQEGYCDYYASSMVVMLRAVGVPARYVRGYSQGTREQGIYQVLESDGHAWPEVFFPGYGWVEFEPTAGETMIVRPKSESESDTENQPRSDRSLGPRNLDEMIDTEVNPDALDSGQRRQPWLLLKRITPVGWFSLLLSALGIASLLFATARRRWQMEGLSLAEQLYEDLVHLVKRLFGIEPMPYQTPYEYADVVSRTVPGGGLSIRGIVEYYTSERFGKQRTPDAEADATWQKARTALWRRWFELRLVRLQRFWWRLVPPQDPHNM